MTDYSNNRLIAEAYERIVNDDAESRQYADDADSFYHRGVGEAEIRMVAERVVDRLSGILLHVIKVTSCHRSSFTAFGRIERDRYVLPLDDVFLLPPDRGSERGCAYVKTNDEHIDLRKLYDADPFRAHGYVSGMLRDAYAELGDNHGPRQEFVDCMVDAVSKSGCGLKKGLFNGRDPWYRFGADVAIEVDCSASHFNDFARNNDLAFGFTLPRLSTFVS